MAAARAVRRLHVLVGCLHNVIAYRYYPGAWRYLANVCIQAQLPVPPSAGYSSNLAISCSPIIPRWTYIYSHNSVIIYIQMFLDLVLL
jgi:hypothetical protein